MDEKDTPQAEHVREAARAPEYTDDEACFNTKFKKVAKAKTKPDAPKDDHPP